MWWGVGGGVWGQCRGVKAKHVTKRNRKEKREMWERVGGEEGGWGGRGGGGEGGELKE